MGALTRGAAFVITVDRTNIGYILICGLKRPFFLKNIFFPPFWKDFVILQPLLLLSNHFRDNLLYILLKDIAE
jgi:hypothetical protein